MSYWKDREAEAQQRLMSKSTADIEKQLRKYYKRTSNRLITEFAATYNKLWNTVVRDNKEPTPADLYKLDSYWRLQGLMRQELQKLGDNETYALQNAFVEHWLNAYESIYIGEHQPFIAADTQTALQMINSIWCADGQTWSNRIWHNVDKLQQTLNDGLIECVLGGRDEKFLKQQLMERFSVSYSNADMIVRTELSHIQQTAAAKRYEDAGIKEFEVWADKDERRCDVCGKLHQKRYLLGEQIPIPAHPRCRCCIIPVVD